MVEDGGHLISVSEDGTIAVTNLDSNEIHKANRNFAAINPDKGADKFDIIRADLFFDGRQENRTLRRRSSFSGDFCVNKFFHLVKVRSQRVFNCEVFGTVDKIIEVKSVNKMKEQLSSRGASTSASKKVQSM